MDIKHCDVLVCGGGVAGIAAAIAAARASAKVILVEREYVLGGLATLGLVTVYLPMCDGLGHQAEYGIVEELLRLAVKHGAEKNYPKLWLEPHSVAERATGIRFSTQFNPWLFALEAERLLKELGVEILYGTSVEAAVRSGRHVEEVILERKYDRIGVQANSYVDATGDSYVISYAGGPLETYKGGNGLASWYYYLQGGKVNLRMFGLSDVVPEKGESSSSDNESDPRISTIRYDPCDSTSINKMIQDGHAKMLADILSHKEKMTDFVPVAMSLIPLLRQSRKLIGDYVLDDKEIGVRMGDSVGTCGDWRKRGPLYEIPFSSLYSHFLANVVVAGRNISVTDAMWDITRVIPVCAVTGEAAGTAAAFCDDFAAIDVDALQKRLRMQGVRLHVEDIRE